MKLRRASIFTKIAVLALIVYACVSIAGLNAQMSQAEEQKRQLQQQVDDAARTNAELQYQIEHSTDDKTIEEVARDKLGLVMPGEKIFVDIGN